MLSIEVKKLWLGHLVSIRDYIVIKGIKEGGIEVKHDGIQDGRTFRLTRDVHGKDHCYFHEYSKNID